MYASQCPLRQHKNADVVSQTKLMFPEHVSQSGICSICTLDANCEIGKKAKEGKTIFPKPFGVAQFGAEKRLPNIEDIQIMPELFGKGIFFMDVKTECAIGGFKTKLPITMAAMGSTKVASSKSELLLSSAAAAGLICVIGENVYTTFGKDQIKKDIAAFKSNRGKHGAILVQINAQEEKTDLGKIAASSGADGIELKLGQGAKQGLGGEVEFKGAEDAQKYEKLGYRIVKTKAGVFQRHTFPGNITEKDLRDLLIKYSEFGLPIWVKIGMGRGILKLIETLEKIKKETGAPLRCLTVDGFGGGTGMGPWLIMNECSMPSAALFAALKKKPSFDILLSGGYVTGFDAAKAMMLGADGVAMGRVFLIATSVGKDGIPNYVSALEEELKLLCATQHVKDVSGLVGKRENLYALSHEAADMFGLPCRPADVL